ncbi:CBS domain-containing protein [Micromonospora rifamycinica]|uniref:CBS domain-containing protein n=1 Tax=Micromonospora rifamycinica TaxID=291594 RepID=A0A109IMT3_9ACTN|nr:hypothetical protein [Micromonospora rifamycinica]KWV33451.1 hypothetical protein AWV63_07085 [Micromonospora rifamycinica]SCG48237.1 hypothetical protein GA0070623_1556 [Micromonospora rifamycinica]
MGLTARDVMLTDHRVVETEHGPPERADELTLGVDGRGTPRWVAGPGGRGPALLIAASTPVDELLTSDALIRLLSELPALVVVDDSGRPMGVVSAEALAEQVLRHLGRAAWPTYGIEPLEAEVPFGMDDPLLAGSLRPPTLPIRVFCQYCGALNHFDEFPEPEQDCVAGGHQLRAVWW